MKNLKIIVFALFLTCLYNVDLSAQDNSKTNSSPLPSIDTKTTNFYVEAFAMPQQQVFNFKEPSRRGKGVSYGFHVGANITPMIGIETGISSYSTTRVLKMVEDQIINDKVVEEKIEIPMNASFVEIPVHVTFNSPLQVCANNPNMGHRLYAFGGVSFLFVDAQYDGMSEKDLKGFHEVQTSLGLGYNLNIKQFGIFVEPAVKIVPASGDDEPSAVNFKSAVGLRSGLQVRF